MRTRTNAVAVVIAAMLMAIGALVATEPASAKKAPADAPVLNIGHRGASGYAPEHTFPAYDLALEMGADYIEQDLQMTRDGVLVVLHDETLDRTARPTAESAPGDCEGLVSERTLAQIKTCDVGTWFNETYPKYADPDYVGLRIPTLEEVFEEYGTSVNYYIETKNPEDAEGMEEELLDLMDEHGLTEPAEENWQVLIQSFSPESLETIHDMNPDLPLIRLFEDDKYDSETIQDELDATSAYAVGIGPSKNDVDAALVEAAHAHCLEVHPYTVNKTSEMRALIRIGVDGMFTNYPDRLERMLGKKGAADGKTGAVLAAAAHDTCQIAA